MKKERGITLISLIIYIIVLCIVIAMLAMVSDMFYKNTDYLKDNSKYVAEYNKFNMYFIEDVKNNKDTYKVEENEIIFEDGTMYTYTEDGVYRNKIKICNNVAWCAFSKSEVETDDITKNIIKVYMIIDGTKLYETENEYVLRYW